MDSDHKPGVNIYLSEERGRIFVKIVDNGPGIPDCIRETLFDPFVTKNKRNGTGLGLALAWGKTGFMTKPERKTKRVSRSS